MSIKSRLIQRYKANLIREFNIKYKLNTLVETGTYEGETINNVKRYFKKIYSIELDRELWEKATRRFKDTNNISVYFGDSGEILKYLVRFMPIPTLFFLDAHYSEGKTSRGKTDTPILEELRTIFNNSDKHYILIDDTNCFGKGDYPTIEQIKEVIGNSELKIIGNIMRIIPK